MNLLNGFTDNSGEIHIKYVVAYRSKLINKWFPRGEYEEMEDAKEYITKVKQMNPTAKYAIFEHIKSETISEICISEEEK